MTDIALGQKLSDCGREFANATLAAMKIGAGVHPPSVIAACARMAGTYLFRSFGLDLHGAQPGQPVLSESANVHAPMLLQTTAGILANLGIAIASAPPAATGDEKAKPLRELLQSQRLLEPLFLPIRRKHELTLRQAAQAAAIATAILIHHLVAHLEPNTAFGIAAFAFIEGSKTAPDPVTLPGDLT